MDPTNLPKPWSIGRIIGTVAAILAALLVLLVIIAGLSTSVREWMLNHTPFGWIGKIARWLHDTFAGSAPPPSDVPVAK